MPAAIALDGGSRIRALALLCPLIALGFWRRAGGDDGGGGSERPGPQLPPAPEIDWERFMRDLDEHSLSRGLR